MQRDDRDNKNRRDKEEVKDVEIKMPKYKPETKPVSTIFNLPCALVFNPIGHKQIPNLNLSVHF